ncbi:phosphoglycerate kinase [Acetobacterium bakii]|uniref:Phosphoglycerate kinase n=1 Tax=Acetobacterium bakii TaxID=52689 RepID=A0A0L6TZM4_9FIRM|nr:phosphoglycerate kinase [Acetobacterium bakii]KNZ41015.1 phosphoglycerate kinase [Acetobacterium bakii]
MKFGINTLDDFEVSGKTVLLRVDINQPVDKEKNTLKDITRIKACVPTIRELSDKGAKLVILAHQGSDIEYENFYTTEPHSKVLSELLNKDVKFIDDVCGPTARMAIESLNAGEILLLDNVRFVAEEQTLFEMNLKLSHEDQAKTLLVRKLAPLADLYVCDAFAAAHRDQPSLCGFEQVLPSAMGRLFEEEYSVLSSITKNPGRPSVFVLGGAKISDAFIMMNSVLGKGIADTVLAGGLVGNIMLLAKGFDIGEKSKAFIKKRGFEKYIEDAKDLLSKYEDKIELPSDLAYLEAGVRKEVKLSDLPVDEMLVDIGHTSTEKFQEIILGAKTVFTNGPMGIFEEEITEYGTKNVWDALGKTTAYTVVGGGDSITATNKYNLSDKINYICTGGGALIRFLTGETLPVVKALMHGSEIKE